MTRKAVWVRVPGSTSNLGAGFDSLGLAVNRYLQIEATESDKWHFELNSPCLAGLPTDEGNLIARTAISIASETGQSMPACEVKVKSELPLARGLGSSAAAIIAGTELADRMLDLELTLEDKLRLACLHENHPDNLAASLYGGFVVTSQHNGESHCLAAGAPDIDMVAVVPPYELKTVEARRVLPEHLPFPEAIKGSGIANLTVAAILQNNWELAGKLMSEDMFHQRYRSALIPDLAAASEAASDAGAYGAALSGAGPTVIVFTPRGSGECVTKQLANRFPEDDVFAVRSDGDGVTSQIKIPSTP
jgi:homoserine kinase